MLHFLGFIFLLLLVGFIIVLALFGAVIRTLFGRKKKGGNSTFTYSYTVNVDHTTQSSTSGPSVSSQPGDSDTVITPEEGDLHINRKKVFDKEEGEYVDFEEVK